MRSMVSRGVTSPAHGAARHRPPAGGDRGALRRPLAGAAVRRDPQRLPARGRLLLHGRSARARRRRRAGRRRPRLDRALGRGARADHLRQPRPPARAGAGLPAGRDRVRALRAPDPARARTSTRPPRAPRTRQGCSGSRSRSPGARPPGRPWSSSCAGRHERDRVRPAAAPGAAAEGDRRLPGVDDAARGRPGALGQADRRRRLGRADARPLHGRGRGRRPAGLGRPLPRRHRRRRPQDDQGARRDAADPRPGRPARPARRAGPGRALSRRRARGPAGGRRRTRPRSRR